MHFLGTVSMGEQKAV